MGEEEEQEEEVWEDKVDQASQHRSNKPLSNKSTKRRLLGDKEDTTITEAASTKTKTRTRIRIRIRAALSHGRVCMMASRSLTEEVKTDEVRSVLCVTIRHKGTDHLRVLLHSHKTMLQPTRQPDPKTLANLVQTSVVGEVEGITRMGDSRNTSEHKAFAFVTSSYDTRRSRLLGDEISGRFA